MSRVTLSNTSNKCGQISLISTSTTTIWWPITSQWLKLDPYCLQQKWCIRCPGSRPCCQRRGGLTRQAVSSDNASLIFTFSTLKICRVSSFFWFSVHVRSKSIHKDDEEFLLITCAAAVVASEASEKYAINNRHDYDSVYISSQKNTCYNLSQKLR